MESSSSGRFHEYHSEPDEPVSLPAPSEGGTSAIDVCDRSIEAARLEEIEKSQYYKATSKVPKVGERVALRSALEKGRLAIELSQSGQSIGYLPTKFSYLAQCLKSGRMYQGKVTASASAPLARIVIELGPS